MKYLYMIITLCISFPTFADIAKKMIEIMETIISSEGTIISWHKSFENTRNKEMGILYPNKD